jgi:predicted PurR-regulated permease PerM
MPNFDQRGSMTSDANVRVADKAEPTDELTAPLTALAIRLGALTILLYWASLLVRPFLSIAIWSVVIAVVLHPTFIWTAKCLGGRRRLAAALVTILGLLVVVGPVTWLAFGLVDSIRLIAERVDFSNLALPRAPTFVQKWPLIGDRIYNFWSLASTNLRAALAELAPQLKPLGSTLLSSAADTGTEALKFLVAIVVAGFLLPPAPSLVAAAKRLTGKLSPDRGTEFVDLVGATIRTVSRGVVGISALQALLAGVGLVVAGVPGATLITSVALILGIIQIGAGLILAPVVIWAWTAMTTTHALLFTVYMLPVMLLDNVLRPFVIGHGLRVPVLVILIGVVGGTLAYGITGLFLGPIVLSVIWELAAAWIGERETA